MSCKLELKHGGTETILVDKTGTGCDHVKKAAVKYMIDSNAAM